MKWIIMIVVSVIGYMIYTGNMGGAKEATGNYVDVRHNQQSPGAEARPNLIHQLIEYNKGKEK